jgi:hypothetical protein
MGEKVPETGGGRHCLCVEEKLHAGVNARDLRRLWIE